MYLGVDFTVLELSLLEVRRVLAHLVDDAVGALLVHAFHPGLLVCEDEQVGAIAGDSVDLRL